MLPRRLKSTGQESLAVLTPGPKHRDDTVTYFNGLKREPQSQVFVFSPSWLEPSILSWESGSLLWEGGLRATEIISGVKKTGKVKVTRVQ